MKHWEHPVGRYAPSPTGRMHLGNIFAAVLSYASAKAAGGRWILRIEDLDPQRSRHEYARLIEDDLRWLGLDWDEGGTDNHGPSAPYLQSCRSEIYADILSRLQSQALTYRCHCRRADILATQAPHQSDGRIVYAGTCRPSPRPPFPAGTEEDGAIRLFVPDDSIVFSDRVFGHQSVNLAAHCGDFVLRRSDGAWAYQLAVVADDALMGITEVVRGCDLLLSAAQQIYLYRLLGYEPPRFCHTPLICSAPGRRLSKRDSSLAMDALRRDYSPDRILGIVAQLAGLDSERRNHSPQSIVEIFDWDKIPATPEIVI